MGGSFGAELTATVGLAAGRRARYDFTFGVPKSVSLAYAWTKDDRIIQRIRQAVSETVEDIERKVAARVRKRGQDFDRTTGNLVGAEFVHLTARPVNGFCSRRCVEGIFAVGGGFSARYSDES